MEYVFIKDYYSQNFEEAPPIFKGSILKQENNIWQPYRETGEKYECRFYGLSPIEKFIEPKSSASVSLSL